MFCSNCGNKLSATNKFCDSCGQKAEEKNTKQSSEFRTPGNTHVKKVIHPTTKSSSKYNLYTGLTVVGLCILFALGWIISNPRQFRYNILGDTSVCPCGSDVTMMESTPFYAFFLFLILGLIQTFRK